jgi:hypothetical protein
MGKWLILVLTLCGCSRHLSYEEEKHLEQQKQAEYIRAHHCPLLRTTAPVNQWIESKSRFELYHGYAVYGCDEGLILVYSDEVQP